MRDITDQLVAQAIFEEQKQQLATIVENSSLGIVLTQENKIIQSNKAFQKLLGYSPGEMKELSVSDISVKDDIDATIEYIEKLDNRAIDQFTINKKYKRRDKSIVWARTSVSAVRDKGGDTKYQVALIEDITDELRHEKLQKALMADLEKSNKDLSDFAHIVSHDLKSPLRSMDALINWLQEDYADAFDDKANETFDILLDKVYKMDHLIDGILKYSSIDKKSKERNPINIHELVNDLLGIIFVPDHVTVTIEKELPTIQGDRYRLQQLFQNLMSNAINAIDKKKGVVTIGCRDMNSFWEFSIRDNGKGIPEKYQQKIFQIFQSIEGDKHSTGIGLSIVKKIIDFYGGTIRLDSEVGKGTTFVLSLPK